MIVYFNIRGWTSWGIVILTISLSFYLNDLIHVKISRTKTGFECIFLVKIHQVDKTETQARRKK